MTKGDYYKAKTKKWLENRGFGVAFLERMMWVSARGRLMPIKRDQFASDLLAVNREQVIFIQVKLGRKNIAAARANFARYAFPDFTDKWIVVWEKGAGKPEILEV